MEVYVTHVASGLLDARDVARRVAITVCLGIFSVIFLVILAHQVTQTAVPALPPLAQLA